jgi:hypothetical protein
VGGHRRAPLEPELLDPVPECAPRDLQPGGGPRDVPGGLVEGLHEMLPLDGAPRVPGRPRARARLRCGLHEPRHHWESQGLRGHERRLGEQSRPLHHVRQLPDVARPGIREERRPRVGGERLGHQTVLGARPPKEVLGQKEDVRPALGERGEPQGDDGEPVIEVFAEPALPHRLQEVLTRRRGDRDVSRLVLRAAETPHRSVLEDLQELRLDTLWQQADLVEEEEAAVGGLEKTRLGLARVGEGPPLEAEQLGLEQGLRDRSAVHLDERPRRPRAGPVKGSDQEALARPRLAQDQQGRQSAPFGPMREQPPNRLSDGLDLRALPEQLAEEGHASALFSLICKVAPLSRALGGSHTVSSTLSRPSQSAGDTATYEEGNMRA